MISHVHELNINEKKQEGIPLMSIGLLIHHLIVTSLIITKITYGEITIFKG